MTPRQMRSQPSLDKLSRGLVAVEGLVLAARGEMGLPPPLLEASREGRMLDEVLHHLSAAQQAVASYESVGKSLGRFGCRGER